MTKFLIPFLTLGLSFLSTSCSDSDEAASLVGGASDENSVAITCEIPSASIHSRGADTNGFYGDGSEATQLVYAVYNENGEKILASDDPGAPVAARNGKYFTISLPRPDDSKTYHVFFWADAWGHDSNTPFTFDWANKTVKVNYWESGAMLDKADAFYNYVSYSAGQQPGVLLFRPFVQINVCTTAEDFASHNDYESLNLSFVNDNQNDYDPDLNAGEQFIPYGMNFESGQVLVAGSEGSIDFPLVKDAVKPTGLPTDRDLCYLAVIYLFSAKADSPLASDFYEACHLQIGFDGAHGQMYNEIDCGRPQSGMAANSRLFIYPKESSSGLLTRGDEIEVRPSPSFNGSENIEM